MTVRRSFLLLKPGRLGHITISRHRRPAGRRVANVYRLLCHGMKLCSAVAFLWTTALDERLIAGRSAKIATSRRSVIIIGIIYFHRNEQCVY